MGLPSKIKRQSCPPPRCVVFLRITRDRSVLAPPTSRRPDPNALVPRSRCPIRPPLDVLSTLPPKTLRLELDVLAPQHLAAWTGPTIGAIHTKRLFAAVSLSQVSGFSFPPPWQTRCGKLYAKPTPGQNLLPCSPDPWHPLSSPFQPRTECVARFVVHATRTARLLQCTA